jgi:hypothetical protein
MRPAATAYRRFFRAYRAFHRWLPWLWFGGCGLCLLVAMLQLGKTWLAVVCAVTVYPAIVGWLSFNGFGILVKTLPRLRGREVARERSAWLFIAPLLLVGVTFAALSVWLLTVLLRGVAA